MCGSTDLCAQKGGINHCKGDAQINTFFPTGLVCVCFFKLFKSFFWGGVFQENQKGMGQTS